MSMATLQFYKNPYTYPDYGSITASGTSMPCTPVGMGLKNGRLRVKGSMDDFMSCNYLRLTRSGKNLYAWIEDINFLTANSFEVSYRVDPWRTYRGSITLGTQYIDRSPTVTYKKDSLLGSSRAYPDISTNTIAWSNSNSRVLVIQVRPRGGSYSNTSVQPSPYQFWVCAYAVNNWMGTQAIVDLMVALEGGAETSNIVTMYSIPYMDIQSIPSVPLDVNGTQIAGFRLINQDVSGLNSMLSRTVAIDIDTNIDVLMRSEHSVQIIVPDSGIINVPDELLKKSDLKLRQDVDLFSGASNYMLVSGDTGFTSHSVRGSGISTIPILSDPMETYLSQNQNALTTSLIGDVATIAIGATTGGGIGAVASGVGSMISKGSSILDVGNRYSNPPAFLGTALAGSFNNRIWVVVTREHVDNATIVNSNYGYPMGKVGTLSFPSSGYIKTEACSVSSDGTVPKWAIEEINSLFDSGILVH